MSLTGQNIGDLLNAQGLSWGWFQGGFRPTTTFAQALAPSAAPQPTSTFIPDQFKGKFAHRPPNLGPEPVQRGPPGRRGRRRHRRHGRRRDNYGNKDDYIAHHEPFHYYASTANPHHLAPASLNTIGTDTQSYVNGVPQFDTANHQYDMSDFDSLVAGINHGFISPGPSPGRQLPEGPRLPGRPRRLLGPDRRAAVHRQRDQRPGAHPGLVQHRRDRHLRRLRRLLRPRLQRRAQPVEHHHRRHPARPAGLPHRHRRCAVTPRTPLAGQNGRCGYGPRLPLLVISPFAKKNFVDHTLTDPVSIDKFVEDNWKLPTIPGSYDAIAGSINSLFRFGEHPDNSRLFLDPTTGQPASSWGGWGDR